MIDAPNDTLKNARSDDRTQKNVLFLIKEPLKYLFDLFVLFRLFPTFFDFFRPFSTFLSSSVKRHLHFLQHRRLPAWLVEGQPIETCLY